MARHDLARKLRIIQPVGTAHENRPILPAPDPPVRGWWIDPEDPTHMRLHDGVEWSHRIMRLNPERQEVRYGPPEPYDRRKSANWYWGSVWLRGILGSGLIFWVTPALDEQGIVYDWLNRLGALCLYSLFLQLLAGVLYTAVFMRAEEHPSNRNLIFIIPPLGIGLSIFAFWLMWGRLLDALWLA